MDLRSTQLKDTYGNLVTTGTTAGSPTTGGLQNGDGQLLTQIGIGTNSFVANTPLTLQAPSGYTDTLWLKSVGTNIDSRINIGPTGTGNAQINNATGTNIEFQVSGSEKMRIDSSGNVGINETDPDSKLHLKSASAELLELERTSVGAYRLAISASDAFSIYDVAEDSDRLVIDSNGSVGIGCTPDSAFSLDVQNLSATSDNVLLRIKNTDNNEDAGIYIEGENNGQNEYRIGVNTFTNTSDLTFSGGTGFRFIPGSSEAMRIDSSGNVGIGNTPTARLQVGTGADALTGTGTGQICISGAGQTIAVAGKPAVYHRNGVGLGLYSDAQMSFEVNGSTSKDEAMRIDASGNVGIGVSPANALHIARTAANSIISLQRTTSNTTGAFGALQWLANDGHSVACIDVRGDGDDNGGEITFRTTSNASANDPYSLTEAMRIDSGGNVTVKDGGFLIIDTGAVASNPRLYFRHNDINATNFIEVDRGTNDMEFWNNGSERMRIDSSGRVGIGETNPDRELDLKNSADNCIMSITSSTSHLSGLVLGDTADDDRGGILYNNTSDYLYFLSNAQERMRIDSSGNLLFGGITALPNGTSVYGSAFRNDSDDVMGLRLATSTSSAKTLVEFFNPNGSVGSIQTNASATAYNTSSDYRLKENVVDMTGALDRVDQLKPSRFNFIADADRTVDGFLAHEVADVVPEAISGEKDAVDDEGNPIYQGIDQSKLVPLLVGAIQELRAEIEQLKNQ